MINSLTKTLFFISTALISLFLLIMGCSNLGIDASGTEADNNQLMFTADGSPMFADPARFAFKPVANCDNVLGKPGNGKDSVTTIQALCRDCQDTTGGKNAGNFSQDFDKNGVPTGITTCTCPTTLKNSVFVERKGCLVRTCPKDLSIIYKDIDCNKLSDLTDYQTDQINLKKSCNDCVNRTTSSYAFFCDAALSSGNSDMYCHPVSNIAFSDNECYGLEEKICKSSFPSCKWAACANTCISSKDEFNSVCDCNTLNANNSRECNGKCAITKCSGNNTCVDKFKLIKDGNAGVCAAALIIAAPSPSPTLSSPVTVSVDECASNDECKICKMKPASERSWVNGSCICKNGGQWSYNGFFDKTGDTSYCLQPTNDSRGCPDDTCKICISYSGATWTGSTCNCPNQGVWKREGGEYSCQEKECEGVFLSECRACKSQGKWDFNTLKCTCNGQKSWNYDAEKEIGNCYTPQAATPTPTQPPASGEVVGDCLFDNQGDTKGYTTVDQIYFDHNCRHKDENNWTFDKCTNGQGACCCYDKYKDADKCRVCAIHTWLRDAKLE